MAVDVLVVGVGPGGCSTAYHLARGGAKVALAGIVPEADATLGSVLLSVLAQTCLQGMGLSEWMGRQSAVGHWRLVGPRGITSEWHAGPQQRTPLVLPRRDLQDALLQACHEAGCTVYLGVRVQDLTINPAGVSFTSDATLPEARLAVLAEGCRAPLARRLGLVEGSADYLVRWSEYDHPSEPLVELHFPRELLPTASRVMPGGRGGTAVAVAAEVAFTNRSQVGFAAEELARVAHGGAMAGARLQGSRLLRSQRSSLRRVQPYAERVLLAGEAAGVVHPLTLEGVGASLESGRVAAQHGLYALEHDRLGAADLSGYSRALQRRFGVDYRAARLLRGLLRSERVMARVAGRAQRDPGFRNMVIGLYVASQSALGTLTPANLVRYLTWWRA